MQQRYRVNVEAWWVEVWRGNALQTAHTAEELWALLHDENAWTAPAPAPNGRAGFKEAERETTAEAIARGQVVRKFSQRGRKALNPDAGPVSEAELEALALAALDDLLAPRSNQTEEE